MTCYICGSENVTLHKKVNDHRLLACKACALIWVENAHALNLKTFYNSEYFKNESITGYSDYLKDESNHRLNARRLLKLISSKKQNLSGLRIIDIGCAYGLLLDESRKMGFEPFGVEWSQEASVYASAELGLKVYQGDLKSRGFQENYFDVALMIGTIEHLQDPKGTLDEIKKILKPGGLVVMTTIDTQGLLPFYSLKPPEHLYYFSHNNLKHLLSQCQFKILSTKSYFVKYRIFDLLHRLKSYLGWQTILGIEKVVEKYFPRLSLTIPTNEMILLAQKFSS